MKNFIFRATTLLMKERFAMKDLQKCLSSWVLVLTVLAALLSVPAQALALPILSSDLSSFAVLGASTVTNTGATTLTGNLGVSPGLAITGQSTITINGQPALTTGSVFVHAGDALAAQAQFDLTAARTSLALMGAGTLLGADLAGLTLTPGVYTVAAGATNLSGTLNLDGLGNANAFWVFQMPSTLITSPGSVVNVINTSSDAGLFWNVGSSATLDTTTSFQGNILALTSITLNTGATIGCGRALADVGAVTMDHNTIGGLCIGSNGLSGGLDVPAGGGTPTPLPPASVPEPSSMLLVATGLAGLAVAVRRRVL